MKKGIIYLLLMFFPLMGVGYTQKSESPALQIYEEWIDHEVEVCGVKDPVVNMDWIQEEMDKYNNIKKYLVIDLYHDFIMTDTIFVFHAQGEIKSVYNCAGEKIYDYEEELYKESILSSYTCLRRIYFHYEIHSSYQLPIVDVWINHEFEACGVKDPILNLDWMATALAAEKARQKEFQVELHKCKETGDIVFVFPKRNNEGNYIQFDVYNCAGDKIYYYEFINAIIPDSILSGYEFIQVIYTYKVSYFNIKSINPLTPSHVGLGCTNGSGCSRPQY